LLRDHTLFKPDKPRRQLYPENLAPGLDLAVKLTLQADDLAGDFLDPVCHWVASAKA
jgi:hypothetical protein